MPSRRHHDFGDLFVNMHVTFPDRIEPEAIPLLESALPPRKPVEMPGPDVIVDEVDMMDMDARQQQEHARGDVMDEDEDGRPRVQCANQ